VVASALTLIIGLAAMPMMLFYMLKDRDSLAEGLQHIFPPTIRPQATAILRILNRTVGSYIRGQLILGLVVGTITAIGLFLLGVPFSILLGITAGFTELIPIVGPWIGGLVGVLVVLASAPEKLPWVILFYLGVQLVENTLLVPRIQGQALGLHPIVVLVVIVVGSQLMGLWGIILGPPLAAAAKEVIRYFYYEWNRPLLYTATGPLTPAPEPGPQDSASEETAPTTRRE
jgi:predicted PurR-regulated permease PerM